MLVKRKPRSRSARPAKVRAERLSDRQSILPPRWRRLRISPRERSS